MNIDYNLSNDFRMALNTELNSLVDKAMLDYEETESFHAHLETAVQGYLNDMVPIYNHPADDKTPLKLYLSPMETNAKRYIDLEELLSEAFEYDDVEHLAYLLSRLETMADMVRNFIEEN